ncbi:MAG: hypothetical protein D6767_05295 [Candidatus Hydrogenedentota bacterium]|nr:MAG: hypothetical protein D6767_05295 [Candidatus Hydrogenedentota bacterium]
MSITWRVYSFSIGTICLLLFAPLWQCSGYGQYFTDEKSKNKQNTMQEDVTVTYTIGGTVSGLSGTLVLQNNGSDDLTITGNGSFSFSTGLANGSVYDVSVKTNPISQVCQIQDNQGTVAGADVTNIQIQCSSDTNWVQDAYLKASNSGTNDQFGYSLAVSGSTVVVGAPYEDSNQTAITNTDGGSGGTDPSTTEDRGAVYVFKRDASGNWIQDAYLKASNSGTNDQFGYSVAVSGSTIVVGAPYEDSNQTAITNTDGGSGGTDPSTTEDRGAVYVFQLDASGNWIQDAYLKASNIDTSDAFGNSVAISGSTIVVGAPNEDSNQTFITNADGSASADNTVGDSGALYVFKRDTNGNWIQDAYLKASNADTNDFFCQSVAISGSTIVTGACAEDSSQTFITNTDGSASTDNTVTDSGAAYVFKRDASGNWIQDAYLKASNAETNDFFGKSVAISGSTIVVGAYWEDDNQSSITNTDGSAAAANGLTDSGAVYVFKRDASGNWIQDAYLKASNASFDDQFGNSVAISGSTIVVGAYFEDSDQNSITNMDGSNGGTDPSATEDRGAVYIFKAF